uniref:Uncharacterized protein n=1 Tax=Meloidogyne javanica TaxID=6303 RepID=A0A915MFZ4_MELJA
MTKDITDFELIQSKSDLKQENEMENKNVFEKVQENQINVEELKQTFQQMIDEIKIENVKQNSVLKEIIEQKNEKIICLENKVKQNDYDFLQWLAEKSLFGQLEIVNAGDKWSSSTKRHF